MVVIPRSRHVALHYGRARSTFASIGLTAVGALGLVVPVAVAAGRHARAAPSFAATSSVSTPALGAGRWCARTGRASRPFAPTEPDAWDGVTMERSPRTAPMHECAPIVGRRTRTHRRRARREPGPCEGAVPRRPPL